jgi:Cu-Zn family superoxide dismutase
MAIGNATLGAPLALALGLAAGGAVSALSQERGGTERRFRTAEVHFENAERQMVGEAVLRETAHGVLVTATLRGLPPGEHGFHVHERGTCEPPFESAGAHFNPTGRAHGFEDADGPHAGDLPNLIVPESGEVRVEMLAPELSLEEGRRGSIVDRDGAALVVHAGPDDYSSDPAGNAGGRIACGIVERPRMAAEGEVVPRAAARPNGARTAGDAPRGAMQVPPPAGAR